MTTDTIENTRGALRAATARSIEEALKDRSERIEGGPLDGVRVVSWGNVTDAIGVALATPLPAVDATSAEVHAGDKPGRVVVWATCPVCGITQSHAVEISPSLTVAADGSRTMKLSAKAKARPHVCNQLPVEDGTDGQATLDELEADDIIGDESDEPREGIEVAPGETAEITAGEDDEDLRPSEPVNVDAVIGEAERASTDDRPAPTRRRGRNAANW